MNPSRRMKAEARRCRQSPLMRSLGYLLSRPSSTRRYNPSSGHTNAMQSYSPAFSWLHPESVLDSLYSLQPLNGSMCQHQKNTMSAVNRSSLGRNWLATLIGTTVVVMSSSSKYNGSTMLRRTSNIKTLPSTFSTLRPRQSTPSRSAPRSSPSTASKRAGSSEYPTRGMISRTKISRSGSRPLPKESRIRVPAFFLGLGDNVLTIFTNVVMAALRAYIATSHPNSTCARQARYSWRRHGARIVAHCVCCVKTLRAIADDRISSAAGVVIVAVITLALDMLDLKYVHIYEKCSSIPIAMTVLVLLGFRGEELGYCADGDRQAESSNILSFMGVISALVPRL
ncbi:Cytosine-purine permease [Mycena sanguinolenta]|uniref:Cytosine-purine permease n=1 Tax=Mycena sanguinolenta TaxID=230812 RepID=A0A8H6XBG4_9AGAR|nr:Cytosine-purine permease [Mycena sanguinolenta]